MFGIAFYLLQSYNISILKPNLFWILIKTKKKPGNIARLASVNAVSHSFMFMAREQAPLPELLLSLWHVDKSTCQFIISCTNFQHIHTSRQHTFF